MRRRWVGRRTRQAEEAAAEKRHHQEMAAAAEASEAAAMDSAYAVTMQGRLAVVAGVAESRRATSLTALMRPVIRAN